MNAAKGILTAKGGMTSHAAVVARGWGKPCVCGCGTLVIHEKGSSMKIKDKVFNKGETLVCWSVHAPTHARACMSAFCEGETVVRARTRKCGVCVVDDL